MIRALVNRATAKRQLRIRGIVDLLYGTDAFVGLTAADFHVFFDHVEAEHCPAGTLLFSPEDSGERLYILREGLVELYRLTPDGRRLVTRRIKPVSIFGLMGLLGQSMQGNFAEAVEASLVCTISREEILGLLKQRPDVAVRLLELLGTRLCLAEERLLEMAYSPVAVRLAHFLLANMDGTSQVVAGFTETEIGDFIGAVRQTVSDVLSLMRRQGIVWIEPKQIRVLQPYRLKEIVEGWGQALLSRQSRDT